jgi:hypothetical protein
MDEEEEEKINKKIMCLPGRFLAPVARLTASSILFNCQITQK